MDVDAEGEALVFTSSGSGAMEACVSSMFEKGEDVTIVCAGKFGKRWVEMAQQYGLHTHIVNVDWGKSINVDALMQEIKPTTRGLLIQACESSTGVYHPIEKIAEALPENDEMFFIVDAITAVGVHDISMKRHKIDALVCGSQKALMCPPGLAVLGLSPRAIKHIEMTECQSLYFSVQKNLVAQRKATTPFTPAVSLILSLHKALEMMEAEGKERIFARCLLMRKMVREACSEIGLQLLNSDEDASFGITSVCLPEGVVGKEWIQSLKNNYGLWIAGGQDDLEGKIFRIAHMGAIRPDDILWGIEKIEHTLASHLPKAKENRGLQRAREILKECQ
jgi:aspartate aminotransferase-like enzyme